MKFNQTYSSQGQTNLIGDKNTITYKGPPRYCNEIQACNLILRIGFPLKGRPVKGACACAVVTYHYHAYFLTIQELCM